MVQARMTYEAAYWNLRSQLEREVRSFTPNEENQEALKIAINLVKEQRDFANRLFQAITEVDAELAQGASAEDVVSPEGKVS